MKADQLCQLLSRGQINFSVIAPRLIKQLKEFHEQVTGEKGESPFRGESQHMVLLRNIDIPTTIIKEEVTPIPAPATPKAPETPIAPPAPAETTPQPPQVQPQLWD